MSNRIRIDLNAVDTNNPDVVSKLSVPAVMVIVPVAAVPPAVPPVMLNRERALHQTNLQFCLEA